MQEELEFCANSVCVDNLEHLSEEASIIAEERIIEITEYADRLLSSAVDILGESIGVYEILSLMSECLLLGESTIHANPLHENICLILPFMRACSTYDKAFFCKLLADCAEKRGFDFSEKAFLPVVKGSNNFAYVRNQFSDEAFDVFSLDFEDARVKYFSNFAECVKSVADGESTYCLLPLEERGGVRLHAVSELMFRHDLKINSVTPVFGIDNSVDMKYAVLSKAFLLEEADEDDDRYLEIRIDSSSELSIAELLGAAAFFGHSVYRVNTVTFETEEGKKSYHTVVFRGENVDFSALLSFLTLFAKDYVAVGVYKNLE